MFSMVAMNIERAVEIAHGAGQGKSGFGFNTVVTDRYMYIANSVSFRGLEIWTRAVDTDNHFDAQFRETCKRFLFLWLAARINAIREPPEIVKRRIVRYGDDLVGWIAWILEVFRGF